MFDSIFYGLLTLGSIGRSVEKIDLDVCFGKVLSIEIESMVDGFGVCEDVLTFIFMKIAFFRSLKELTDGEDVRHLLCLVTGCIGMVRTGQFPILIFFNSHKFILTKVV